MERHAFTIVFSFCTIVFAVDLLFSGLTYCFRTLSQISENQLFEKSKNSKAFNVEKGKKRLENK